MSRHHAALRLDRSGWLLEDLFERRTVVAGQRHLRCMLPDGAFLQLGKWSAVFRERDFLSAAEPPGPTGAQACNRTIDTIRTGFNSSQGIHDT